MMNFKYLVLYFVFSTLTFAQVESELNPPDYIKTITFKSNTNESQLPILKLNDRLQLEFDVLNGDEDDFYYTIDLYNFDWTPSNLSKGEYMEGFDDSRIYTYENSLNTLQIFSHYRLSIPNREIRRLTKSGNYIISFKDDNGDLVFTRKFMIIEDLVNVPVAIKRSRNIKSIEYKQVVQFSINSPDFFLNNPKHTVKTLVIKNNDINRGISNLIPQYTIGGELIYYD